MTDKNLMDDRRPALSEVACTRNYEKGILFIKIEGIYHLLDYWHFFLKGEVWSKDKV
jgi:hypothetical protein